MGWWYHYLQYWIDNLTILTLLVFTFISFFLDLKFCCVVVVLSIIFFLFLSHGFVGIFKKNKEGTSVESSKDLLINFSYLNVDLFIDVSINQIDPWKYVSSRERVKPCFFVTFYIIISHIFSENFIEIPKFVQTVWLIFIFVAILINF